MSADSALDVSYFMQHTSLMKTANVFTLTRIVLSPLFFVLYFIPIWTGKGAAVSAFVLIPLLAFMEFTDFLDGLFARKNGEVSDFGKLFDPFADVIVHLTTFACFLSSYSQTIGHYVPTVIYLFIVYREVTMNFLRMIAARKGVAIAARKGGKLKTVFYVATGFVCLVLECSARFLAERPDAVIAKAIFEEHAMWQNASFVMFCISLALCYISFADYLIHFGGTLK